MSPKVTQVHDLYTIAGMAEVPRIIQYTVEDSPHLDDLNTLIAEYLLTRS